MNYLNAFNLQDAIENLMLDKDEILELVDDYLVVIEDDVELLLKAIKASDAQEVKILAHKIKGALKNLRFERSGFVAAKIEKIAKEEQEEDLDDHFNELVSEIELAKREVELVKGGSNDYR